MGPRIREDNGRGWIPATVFMGAGSPRREEAGMRDGLPPSSSRGQCLRRGMGPRIREDTGGG